MEDSPTIEQTMQQALLHHRAGHLAEATQCLQSILCSNPHHAPALHLLGTIAAQAQQPDLAISFLEKAIASDPQSAFYHSALGSLYHAQGKLQHAETQFVLALKLAPNQAETLGNLALVSLALGKTAPAIDAYRQAIALKPDLPELHFQLGNALHSLGIVQEAISSYEAALTLRPTYPEALCNLGLLLTKLGRFDQAVLRLESALSIHPNSPETQNAYGAALQKMDRLTEAAVSFRQAIALKPNYVQALSNLGSLFEMQGLLDESIEFHQRALAFEPDYPEAHNSLGNVLGSRGNFSQAIAHFKRAIDLKPSLTEAYYNMAMVELRTGDFPSGWQHYEWRWHSDRSPLKKNNFSQPQWHGEPLNGATILLHAEQGLGDTLQFLRYVPMVQKAGGRVILELPSRLLRIAAELPEVAALIPAGEALPPFDWHCPLLSLPLAFGTTLETIPAVVPYLSVPDDARKKAISPAAPLSHTPCAPFISAPFAEMSGKAEMSEIARAHSSDLRVGLLWAGKSAFVQDRARQRSINFFLFRPLLEVEGPHFFSLQIGEAVQQLPQGLKNLTDLSPYVEDMADTAAQIEQLDLVISVDTAVAHLAGALGVETWLLLPFASDWRWLHARSDSPWYPTMRLFQQPTPGDWPSVIADVSHALSSRVSRANVLSSKRK